MPEAVEGKHAMELGNDTVFDKNLPIVKNPKSVMDHLHAKTYYKSYQQILSYGPEKKLDPSDLHMNALVKDIKKVAL